LVLALYLHKIHMSTIKNTYKNLWEAKQTIQQYKKFRATCAMQNTIVTLTVILHHCQNDHFISPYIVTSKWELQWVK
jgi:hypothetical protein